MKLYKFISFNHNDYQLAFDKEHVVIATCLLFILLVSVYFLGLSNGKRRADEQYKERFFND